MFGLASSSQVDALIRAVLVLTQKVSRLMITIDQVAADVTAQKTTIAGLATLVAGLRKQIADALSGATLPPAVQAKVDAVFTDLEANNKALADALAANTPATP